MISNAVVVLVGILILDLFASQRMSIAEAVKHSSNWMKIWTGYLACPKHWWRILPGIGASFALAIARVSEDSRTFTLPIFVALFVCEIGLVYLTFGRYLKTLNGKVP